MLFMSAENPLPHNGHGCVDIIHIFFSHRDEGKGYDVFAFKSLCNFWPQNFR